MNKIAEHFKRHKIIYIGVGCFVAGATLAYFTSPIMRDFVMKSFNSGKAHLNGHTGSGKAHLNGHTVFNFSAEEMTNNIFNDSVVNVLEREGRGHPGYMVRHIETNAVYKSQKSAADALGFDYKHMSDHLNGRKEHILGNHFERLNLVT